MSKKPWAFNFLSLVLGAFTLSYPLQAVWYYDLSMMDVRQVMSVISASNWILISFLLLNIALSIRASRWILLSLPCMVIWAGWNSYLVHTAEMQYQQWQLAFPVVALSLVSAFILLPDSFKVLKNQNLRWWRIEERFDLSLPVTAYPFVGKGFNATSLNISKSGVFLQLDSVENLSEGDLLDLSIRFDEVHSVKCQGRIARLSSEKEDSPLGIGVEFQNQSRDFYKQCDSLLN